MSVDLSSRDPFKYESVNANFSFLSKEVLQQNVVLSILFLNYVGINDWFSSTRVCRQWRAYLSPFLKARIDLKIYLDTSSSMNSSKQGKNSFLKAKDAINEIGSHCLQYIGKLELHTFSNVAHKPQTIESQDNLVKTLNSLKCQADTSYDFLEAVIKDSVEKGKNNLLFRRIYFITDMDIPPEAFSAFLTKLNVIKTVANLQLILVNVGPEKEPALKKILDMEIEKLTDKKKEAEKKRKKKTESDTETENETEIEQGDLSFITWRNFPPEPPRAKKINLRDEEIKPLDPKRQKMVQKGKKN